MTSAPKVSVLMITYNHEPYIAEAVESALMQHTNFPFEVVIGEDCSTDRTREILLEYKNQNPDRIRLLLRDPNLGMMRNFVDTYHACAGEYVAILEGDDYWTESTKLQRQVDAMERHLDWSLCFHPARYVDEAGKDMGKQHPWRTHDGREFGLKEVMVDNPVQTCSILLRRSAVPRLPDFFFDLRLGDWPLCILTARQGPLGYLDNAMSAYRVHAEGIWSTASAEKRVSDTIDMYLQLTKNYPDIADDVKNAIVARIFSIRNSWTFRVGRIVLWPFYPLYRILKGSEL